MAHVTSSPWISILVLLIHHDTPQYTSTDAPAGTLHHDTVRNLPPGRNPSPPGTTSRSTAAVMRRRRGGRTRGSGAALAWRAAVRDARGRSRCNKRRAPPSGRPALHAAAGRGGSGRLPAGVADAHVAGTRRRACTSTGLPGRRRRHLRHSYAGHDAPGGPRVCLLPGPDGSL